MDNKFYVSLYAARLLNEKGYDRKRDFLTPVYIENGYHIENGNLYWSNHEDLSDKIPAITKAEAIDWLESKGIMVWVEPTIDGWLYFMKSEQHYEDNAEPIFGTFETRLEAEEAAIVKACELL